MSYSKTLTFYKKGCLHTQMKAKSRRVVNGYATYTINWYSFLYVDVDLFPYNFSLLAVGVEFIKEKRNESEKLYVKKAKEVKT